ncbi:MAG: hypothetical protein KC592_02195, partial [Nitrospira sp.]|nr:hypothetical protein [Nitrospira sp.]
MVNFIQTIFLQAGRVQLFVLGLALLCLPMASPLQADTLSPIHHTLHIELDPDTHAITGLDTIHLPSS